MNLDKSFATMIRKGSEDYYKLINKLILPIKNIVKISSVAVHKIYPDGRFFQVSNCPDIQAYMCALENFKHIPFYSHPDFHFQGRMYSKSVRDQNWESLTNNLSKKFIAQDNRFFLSSKKNKDNSITCFVCSLAKQEEFPEEVLIKKSGLLELFAQHFQHKIKHVMETLESNTVNLNQVLGKKRFMTSPLQALKEKSQKEVELLEQSGLLPRGSRHISTLSYQEKQCLMGIITGGRIKDIASSMNLSPRTVEHYLESAKNKLRVFSKKELVEIGAALKQSGYLF